MLKIEILEEIDESKSTDNYNPTPNSPGPSSSPSMNARFSNSTLSIDTANLTWSDSDNSRHKHKKSLFGFNRKKSQEKVVNINHTKQSSVNQEYRLSTTSNSSVGSSGIDNTNNNIIIIQSHDHQK